MKREYLSLIINEERELSVIMLKKVKENTIYDE